MNCGTNQKKSLVLCCVVNKHFSENEEERGNSVGLGHTDCPYVLVFSISFFK